MSPVRFHKYGIGALLIEWDAIIDTELIDVILFYEHQLRNKFQAQIFDLVPAYNSLLINFNYRGLTYDQLITFITQLLYKKDTIRNKKHWDIAVDYSTTYAIDLAYLSDVLQLDPAEIIGIHSSTLYTVHFIGFLPGFPYLSGLDKRLHCPRRSNPRIRIPAGSVAIGGQQTGIYPVDSPGGWHLIGHTDFTLFDISASPPSPIQAGDTIQFNVIKNNN